MKDKVFIIVDQSMSGFQGHHYNYSISVFKEIIRRDISAYIFCNKSLQVEIGNNSNLIPAFSTKWQNYGTENLNYLRAIVEKITKVMPVKLQNLWLHFIWSMKRFVFALLKEPKQFGFIEEFLAAETALPKHGVRTYFFHSIHNDSFAAIISAKLDEIRQGSVRLNIVLRTDPPTGKSRENLEKSLIQISEDKLLRKSIALFSDTPQLCDLYNELSSVEFQCLPIPLDLPRWDNSFAAMKKTAGKRCLTLGYLGDARREKGYDLLPKMVSELSELFEDSKLRLVHQCSFPVFGGEPEIADAKAALDKWPDTIIRALPDPLSVEDYFELLQSLDILLLPYEVESYGGRSSGILAEALAFGIPAVVPQNSWMSDQVKDGFGETFGDQDDFIDAVRTAVENWPEQKANCLANVADWRKHHSPKSLVDMLI